MKSGDLIIVINPNSLRQHRYYSYDDWIMIDPDLMGKIGLILSVSYKIVNFSMLKYAVLLIAGKICEMNCAFLQEV